MKRVMLLEGESFQLGIFRAAPLRLTLVEKEFARSHCTELRRRIIQQRLQFAQRARTRPRQREMRVVRLCFTGETQFFQSGINRRCKVRQTVVAIYSRPEDAYCFRIGKESHAGKPHGKKRGLYRSKRALQ